MLTLPNPPRVQLDTAALPWVATDSPAIGVKGLEGPTGFGSVAALEGRRTYLVAGAAGAPWEFGAQALGGEILILEGELVDATGRYPTGTFLKVLPKEVRAFTVREDCLLFVKEGGVEAFDGESVRVPTRQAPWVPGLVDGLAVLPLWEAGPQHTALVRWAPGTRFHRHRHYGGEEIFVVAGTFQDEHGSYPQGTWLRSPHLSEHTPYSDEGCVILVKTGHLLGALREGSLA